MVVASSRPVGLNENGLKEEIGSSMLARSVCFVSSVTSVPSIISPKKKIPCTRFRLQSVASHETVQLIVTVKLELAAAVTPNIMH